MKTLTLVCTLGLSLSFTALAADETNKPAAKPETKSEEKKPGREILVPLETYSSL